MQNKQKLVKTITLSLLLGVGTWCTGTALAAEELSEFTLAQMVVTATKTEKKLIDTPANAQIITKQQIKEAGFSSPFELVSSFAQGGAMG